MLWGRILKIETTRRSRNEGEFYKTVYFKIFDDRTKKTESAKMDLVTTYRNYRHWENYLKIGAMFKNLAFRKPHMIDADCASEFVKVVDKPIDSAAEIKKPLPKQLIGDITLEMANAKEFLAHSASNKYYKLSLGQDGAWICECEAFKYGAGKPCKHIRALTKYFQNLEDSANADKQGKLI